MKRFATTSLLVVAAVAAGSALGSQASNRQPVSSAVVWAVGDGANGGARPKALARRIAQDRPARFLYLGDVYPAGTAAGFSRGYDPVYGGLTHITEPTPGNHDWGARSSGYYPYWQREKGRRQPPWYRLRLGGWEVLGLNSQAAHGQESSQLRWLRGVLRGGGNCRLAFWHRPRFSAGRVHGDQPDVAPLWNALRGRARLVVNGHEHNLQRFRPREGLTEYVAGAGGHVRYGLRPDSRLAFGRADVDGALRIALSPGRAVLEFRAASGRVLDRSEAGCRAAG